MKENVMVVIKRRYWMLACGWLLVTVAGAQEAAQVVKRESPAFRGLDANLYMQTSAEYRAVCYQTFQLAELRLRQILAQPATDGRVRAVVLDLDETVLDNAGFQSWMLRTGAAYDQAWFDRWEETGGENVELIPGAKAFIDVAKELGARVVLISNRHERFRAQTKTTLSRLGLPVSMDADLKLSTTTSDKTARRREVEETEGNEIVLIVGDNLRDFDERFRTPALGDAPTGEALDAAIAHRKQEVDATRDDWGNRWVVVPNPAYGEWMKPLGRRTRDLERLKQSGRPIGIAFWNVENLFDLEDDPDVEKDEEFTPDGPNQWTAERLNIKLDNLARVIMRMHDGAGPSVLGLAEVENRAVLEMLRNRLKPLGRDYQIVHHDSPSGRGIDCALFFDAAEFKLALERFHIVQPGPTREIVEVQLTHGPHAVTFFVNHWPSRGHDEFERVEAAKTLRTRVDELLLDDAFADIVVMGDFNDYPEDRSVKDVLRATGNLVAIKEGTLFNSSWAPQVDASNGTHVYNDKWQVLDQIIYSPGMLLPGGISWGIGSTQTAILAEDQIYHPSGPGIPRPSRSYSRTTFHEDGYSDHLPLISTIYVTESD